MVIRRDDEIRGLDVEAGIAIGVLLPGSARNAMFSEVAIAASYQAQELGISPYSVAFLADCVRCLGIDGVLPLPEPLVGQQPTALARRWLSAATGTDRDIARDDLLARWLTTVATLLQARKQVPAEWQSSPQAVAAAKPVRTAK